MRTRIDTVTFTAGTRSINSGITNLTIDDIRLICNETKKVILCSSMQKFLIESVSNGVVTYVASYIKTKSDGTTKTVTLPVLASGDKITFEIDQCVPDQTLTEVTSAEITAMVNRIKAR